MTDVGLTGPDKGAGGDYLFVPPGYKGTLPEKGYYVARPRTNRLARLLSRVRGEGRHCGGGGRRQGQGGRLPAVPGRQSSGRPRSSTSRASSSTRSAPTISASTRSSTRWCRTSRPIGSIRIPWACTRRSASARGKPFAPDARMKKILTDAVAVGNAIARSNLFASRDPRTRIYTRPAMAHAVRGRQLPVPRRRGAPARRADHVLLLRHRHHARHERGEAGHRVPPTQ